MSEYLFLDLETTGLEEKDRICELAVICEDEESLVTSSDALCKSSKKISHEAMALHHITNEMLTNEKVCQETSTYKLLQEHNTQENILIAHNIRFDLEMLAKEGFEVKMQLVDTLRCVKSLIPECEQFGLQFLRYELGLYKEEKDLAQRVGIDLVAHRALSDALHVKLLWKTLLQYATVSQLVEISSRPVLLEKFPFGKYSGRYIEEIVSNDTAYLHWMLNNIKDMDEDLSYSIKKYLEEGGL
jgi:DNA polymerase-3 subunit epsilon/exodeoxyribonuclease X